MTNPNPAPPDPPRPFGITVRRAWTSAQAKGRFWKEYQQEAPEGWTAFLPHSCDRWEIVGDAYGDALSQTEAIEDLERFIIEAQEALAALRDGREYGDGD